MDSQPPVRHVCSHSHRVSAGISLPRGDQLPGIGKRPHLQLHANPLGRQTLPVGRCPVRTLVVAFNAGDEPALDRNLNHDRHRRILRHY